MGSRWVHIVCALYTPGVAFGDVERLSPVTLFEMPYNKWGAKVVNLSINLFISLSACLSLCLFADLSVCLPVCLLKMPCNKWGAKVVHL